MKPKELVENITNEYIRRLENDIHIPPYLEKQKNAIMLLADNNSNGLYLLKEGLIEEREWITNLLTNAE